MTGTPTTKTTVIISKEAPPANHKEEPIRLSRYPDGQKGDHVAAIERDDWPAPPEPAAAYPELRTLSGFIKIKKYTHFSYICYGYKLNYT